MDVMGTCDAFCEVEWQGQKFKTTIKKNSYSPDWNETFAFPVENISAGVSCLSVVVMDWDMMSKNDLVGEVVIPGNTLQGFLQGKHTVTMEDSFEVLNKGEAVIGNDKKPCLLNLKMRLVVPDEEASPPVTAQRSLTAQHSQAFEEVWDEYFDSYGRAYYYCETSGRTTWEKPAVKSRGGEAGNASDAERKEEETKKNEEERKAREDAKAAAAAAEASFLVKLKDEQDRKNREEESKKAEYILAIQRAEDALLLKSTAEQEAAEKKAAAEKAAADAKVVLLENFVCPVSLQCVSGNAKDCMGKPCPNVSLKGQTHMLGFAKQGSLCASSMDQTSHKLSHPLSPSLTITIKSKSEDSRASLKFYRI
jgi:hypothetical protein